MEERQVTPKEIYELQYRLRLSVRYHALRARYYTLIARWIKAISVFGASLAGISGLQERRILSLVSGVVTATLAAVDWAFDFSGMANLHNNLINRWSELEREFLENRESLDSTKHGSLFARISALEAKEPPSLGALVRRVQNELAWADKNPDAVRPLTLWQRMTMQLFDHDVARPEIKRGSEARHGV